MGPPIHGVAARSVRVWVAVVLLVALPAGAAARQAEITLTLDEAVRQALERYQKALGDFERVQKTSLQGSGINFVSGEGAP